jgi:YD repeat-containing protein
MKVVYDKRTDTLSVVLREGSAVAESDEDKPGVILDYDDQGNLVSLEILDASRRVTEARSVEFQMAE